MRTRFSALAAASLPMIAGTIALAAPTSPVQFETEPNNTFEEKNHLVITELITHISGKLEKSYIEDCEPDTYMVLFDKLNNHIRHDDNSSPLGNGWASAIFDITDGNGLIDNGDGTRSLRVGVTGRADGLDGNFNGLFQNNPHLQFGEFTLTVIWYDEGGVCPELMTLPDDLGQVANPQVYVDRFEIGAEAFRINFVVPEDAVRAEVIIDNTTGMRQTCRDVDFLRLENLVPLCDYCFTQVGGIDCECRPTDTLVGWFDKLGEVILLSYDWDLDTGYDELCFTADANGTACLAITGEGDENFDGLHDLGPRAPIECDLREWGHGVCGCWTFALRVIGLHGEGGSPMGPDDGGPDENEIDEAILNAMTHGDINMDGLTNTADLGILLGNWGWTLSPGN